MRTITSNNKQKRFFLVAIIFFLLFAIMPQVTLAQYRIISMVDEHGNGNKSVVLAKLKLPSDPKPKSDVLVEWNPRKEYASGTIFQTKKGQWIILKYKTLSIDVAPNTIIEINSSIKGSSVTSLFGRVKAQLKAAASNLGFFRMGNGYVWAHAEGTVFSIESMPDSKRAKFSTEDNSIINILDPYDCDVSGRSEDARALTLYKAKQLDSNGEYVSGDLPPVNYSYGEAVDYMLKRINSKSNSDSYESIQELADDYLVLADIYIEGKEYSKGIEMATNAREIYDEWEPDSQDYYYASLLLADALVESGQLEAGGRLAEELLPVFLEELNFIYDACHGQDVNDDLGWAYDVLGRYYGMIDQDEKADSHDDKADYYDEQGDKYECLD